MIDDITDCVEAHSWDGDLQLWVSAAKIAEGFSLAMILRRAKVSDIWSK